MDGLWDARIGIADREKEERSDETEKRQDNDQLMREFEADIFFRTRMPANSEDFQERIPSLVQGRAAYETVAVADRLWKETIPQTSKKA